MYVFAKYGFVQHMGCPMQSSDGYFAQQTMYLLSNYNSWIVHSVSYAKYGLSTSGFICFEVTACLRLCKAS